MGDTRNFKVVLLGEGWHPFHIPIRQFHCETSLFLAQTDTGCVGKTSLMLRYVQNQFNDKHLTTIQASFLSKKLTVDGVRVNLAIWDTAGQEKFHALGPIYYRDSNGLPSSPLPYALHTHTPLLVVGHVFFPLHSRQARFWCTTSRTGTRLTGCRTG